MLALIDSTVFLDFYGRPGPEQHSAAHVLGGAAAGGFEAVVALQTLQEVADVRRRRGQSIDLVIDYVRWIKDTFRVLEHRAEDADTVLELLQDNPGLGGGDAMIYSSGMRAGAECVVTRDKAFGRALGDLWVDPTDPDSLKRLLDQ